MRFGFCTAPENAPTVMEMGFDYVEIGLGSSLRPEQPEHDIMPEVREKIAAWPNAIESVNGFLPGDLMVVGPDADTARQERYLRSAFHRVAAIGGQIVVFGSGGSRNVPEGFPKADAERQVIAFLKMAGPLAAAARVAVAIEPLNTSECNMITSVADAMAIARAVNHPNIRVLSDLYHVDRERQSHGETRDAGAWLAHVHVAGKVGRRAPNSEDVDYLAAYFRILKEMDYAGRISVEGHVSDINRQAPEALAALRNAWRIA